MNTRKITAVLPRGKPQDGELGTCNAGDRIERAKIIPGSSNSRTARIAADEQTESGSPEPALWLAKSRATEA